nr:Chain B, Single-stranded DNA-binding C-terminal tail peptide [synthetic construct]3C94_C Chain C, Single-stranded DNA-binding C-terminal tail peptide [synthetic construct]4NL8_C Chain C, Single-stranded DNA-binding protein [Klebsiella pneumoniae subsp. pneumoniae HS11286]4NL8_D Chain D, Single-stranded DNA-binding protein [Klebsiella pneumoniae subsp. pneumoniae HS11286]4NL8_F Chain F, Single-stranded DNA-binding protein [Klebsiella pneumoniae subsp. pneumoniae HS11286]4Z0U_D Chain D, SSB-C
WMDFDDDIPF